LGGPVAWGHELRHSIPFSGGIMSASSLIRPGLVALLASVLCGCTGNSSGTVPVSGKVIKDGQPVSGAVVAFMPNAPDGKAASGTTDASGAYNLTTIVNGDGAMPGSYKVTVTKFAGAAAAAGPSTGGQATPADIDAAYKAAEKQGQSVMNPEASAPTASPNELAAKFANPDTSGFTAEVKAGETKSFDFNVTDK